MNGEIKISSGELAKKLNITPSQVRADLNRYSGAGLQGYGYNVKVLYTEISRDLGVGDGMSAAIIGTDRDGAPHLALWLEGRGISNTEYIPNDEKVYDEVEKLCCDVVLVLDCADKEKMQSALGASSVKGVWNMTQSDFDLNVPTVNLPVGDVISSLMYEIKQMKGEE
jgi:redox-sensing transcriptional repressor